MGSDDDSEEESFGQFSTAPQSRQCRIGSLFASVAVVAVKSRCVRFCVACRKDAGYSGINACVTANPCPIVMIYFIDKGV